MNELLTDLIREGYDIHLSSIKTVTGLHHPESLTHFGISLLRRIPGTRVKGGSCYANGKIPWDLRNDSKAWTTILTDLRTKVDKAAVTKQREVKI